MTLADGCGRSIWPPAKIPSLDGLRAISILLVMVGHASATRNFPVDGPAWLFNHGELGVQIFFVISGFLITTLLLEERRATGTINLRLFYLRRTIRIVPAFLLFVATIAVLSSIGYITLPPGNLLHAVTYTMNYVKSGVWWTGHLWSLSVEEQFYVVWPALVCFAGAAVAFTAAGTVWLLSPVIIGFLLFIKSPVARQAPMWFPLVADGIASGCLMAAAVMAWRSRPSFERLLQSRGVAMAPLAILLLDAARWRGRIFLPFGELLMTLAIALSIARFAVYPKSAFASLLNSRWMMAIGTLSYSLYLWQQLFLDPYSNRLWTTFPANVAFAFAAASASYFLVERPLLNLRRRFHPVAPGVASFQHEVQPASLDLHSTAVVP